MEGTTDSCRPKGGRCGAGASPRAPAGGPAKASRGRAAQPLDVAVAKARRSLLASQGSDGYWVFDLEADSTITSEYILLQRFLGRSMDPGLLGRMTRYLRARQLPDGGWPLYEAGKADLSASVKAYFALKVAGDSPDAPHLVRARRIILSLGGASKVNVFTRITLALFGQIPWHTTPAMPVEMVLLPQWFFFHLSKVSYWSRTVVMPLLLLYAMRPVRRLTWTEGVAELFVERPDALRHLDCFGPGCLRKNLFILLDRVLKTTDRFMPLAWRDEALRRAEAWTVERMGQGGIGAIFPAMANAVMALQVLGRPESDPDYRRGLQALDDLVVDRGEEAFCQPCVSPIWDTCLSISAALEAGIPEDAPEIRRAADWLGRQQILNHGDWSVLAPGLEPGGWAFQFENAAYPDLDDTAMVLMALVRAGGLERPELRERIAKGVNWIVGMQSCDGGWGAFDIDNCHLYLNDIPFADHGALLDPSTSDLTARCIEVLAVVGFPRDLPAIAKGVAFLRREQEEFGGWFGRWGSNYIYGTWSVLVALARTGEDMAQPYVRKAVDWLVSRQNGDGGWGETLASYDDPGLAGHGPSTASQTAWALLGLMAAGEVCSRAVERGVDYLLAGQNRQGLWDEPLFTGTGFPRVFYLRYHGYSRYFPLWALGVYGRLKAGRQCLLDDRMPPRPADLRLPAMRAEGPAGRP